MSYEPVPDCIKSDNRYRRTFPRKANARRCDLIEKQYSGLTKEERSRPFADHPGWKEECDRREQANLSDAERTELAGLESALDVWERNAPWNADRNEKLQEFSAFVQEMKDKLEQRATIGERNEP